MSLSSLFFSSYLNFTLIIVDNIYHSQNVSSNRNETLTVTCSHSAKTVEFRSAVSDSYGYHSGFKLLRLALRFHIFSCWRLKHRYLVVELLRSKQVYALIFF